MGLLEQVRDAQREVRRQAIERYRERTPERQEFKAAEARDGVGKADTADRTAQFALREQGIEHARRLLAAGLLPRAIERRIGPTLDYTPFAPSDASRRAGRPVARLVEKFEGGMEPVGFATGFLIAPRLLITNHHVFPTRSDAAAAGANFLYERTDQGLDRGFVTPCDPQRFYISDEALDFAIVALAADARLDDMGIAALVEATPKILKGHPVNIIQHPEGGPKQYALAENKLVDVLDLFLHYETDTQEGSSGSPAFSADWQLVALHHAGIPATRGNDILTPDGDVWSEDMGDDQVLWVANEGARISAIVQRLSQMQAGSESQAVILRELLSQTTDPIADLNKTAAPSMSAALSTMDGGGGMAQSNFSFSGPVTINVQAPPPPSPVVASPPPPKAESDEKVMQFDPDYRTREGYDPHFLDANFPVPTPTIAPARMKEILKLNGKPRVLKYHHFELVMNEERRLQMWSAVNVDYDPQRKSQRDRKEFGTDKWIADRRIAEELQILGPAFYDPAKNIDRGHIVRREDNAWGDDEREIEYANSDTFHWTNCTPQHEAFNQSAPGKNDPAYVGMKGLWGDFENYVQQSRKGDDTKCCILAGPVLNPKDPKKDFGEGAIQYPLRFWKVMCVLEPDKNGDAELKVFGFLLDQSDVVKRFGIEVFRPGRFQKYQVALTEITKQTGVVFAPALLAADTMRGAKDWAKLESAQDVAHEPKAAPKRTPAKKAAKAKRAKKRR